MHPPVYMYSPAQHLAYYMHQIYSLGIYAPICLPTNVQLKLEAAKRINPISKTQEQIVAFQSTPGDTFERVKLKPTQQNTYSGSHYTALWLHSDYHCDDVFTVL